MVCMKNAMQTDSSKRGAFMQDSFRQISSQPAVENRAGADPRFG
jgi:hypothetical protein